MAFGATLAALVLSPTAAQAAARLDPSFGEGGIVSALGPKGQISPARKVVPVPGGNLLALGNSPNVDFEEMVLAGFNSGGSLDDDFGQEGFVYTADFQRSQPIGFGMDLAIAKGGRVLTTGPLTPAGSFHSDTRLCSFISRQKANGHLDRSFALDGRYMLCIHKRKGSIGLDSRTVSVQANGKTVVAGISHHSAIRTGAFVARFNRDGKSLDRSFRGNRRTRLGPRGIVGVVPKGEQFANFTDVKVLRTGKILAVGSLHGRFMAARFTRTGALDAHFGKNGIASFDVDGLSGCNCSSVAGMARDSRGRIVLAGYTSGSTNDSDLRLALVRLTGSGKIDRSFGRGGISIPPLLDFLENDGDETGIQRFLTSGITIQRNGQIVVSGEYNFRYALVRLRGNGELDPSFFEDGVYADWVRGLPASAWSVTTDLKGRIVSSGGTEQGGFVLMRFLP